MSIIKPVRSQQTFHDLHLAIKNISHLAPLIGNLKVIILLKFQTLILPYIYLIQ